MRQTPPYGYREMRKHPVYERMFYYRTLTFDLGVARADEEISLEGNVLAVLNSSSDGIAFQIKFWREVSETLTLEKGSHLSFPFKRFYLTNAVQADSTLYLLVVKGMSWSELISAGGLGFDITPDTIDVNVIGGFTGERGAFTHVVAKNNTYLNAITWDTFYLGMTFYKGTVWTSITAMGTAVPTSWRFAYAYRFNQPGGLTVNASLVNPGTGTIDFPYTAVDLDVAVRIEVPFDSIGVKFEGTGQISQLYLYVTGELY